MSKDIRSFFSLGAKKPTSKVPSSPVAKRKAPKISSDEDEVPETPQDKRKESRTKKRRVAIVDSDEDCSVVSSVENANKKPNLSKLKQEAAPKKELKKVDASAMFGGEPTRVERKKPQKKDEALLLLDDDDEFEQSMMELDESQLVVKSPVKENDNTSEETSIEKLQNKNPPEVIPQSPVVSKKQRAKPPRTPDLEKSVLSDEERYERKRMSGMLYQKFKNRSTNATNPGSKEIPKGKPNCLAGLTFLVTGVLESMDRDEANQVIKDLGGKMSTTVGKRLNYLVAGEESGPKKLADAENLGIKILSEDDLLNLIREKSGEKVNNNAVTKKSPPRPEKKNSPPEKKPKIGISPPEKTLKIKTEPEFEETVVKKEIKINVKSENKSELKKEIVQKKEVDPDMLAWVDKYKPTELKQIIGQQGPASNSTKLLNWLTKWYSNHDGKKKLQKPNPWAKSDDGSFYKAALLSGPPGVGKTTTATLVSQHLGFDIVEFNASDTRSKRLLKEEVSELLTNKSLYGYFHGNEKVTKKHVLIMDEVDGMAGNEDRGGIQELIGLIKDSSVPVICMCNDRNHQKMRSLVNYCYDLRFNKPRLEQIKGPIMSICFKEGFKLPPGKIDEVIAATNNDIRQTLNHLSLLSAGKDLKLPTKEGASNSTAKKDMKLGPWEVVRKVFSAEEHKSMSMNDKSDLFFNDYSLGPLFVQQNYLIVAPQVKNPIHVTNRVALTADSLSLGDLVEKRIRSINAWSLLPTQAMFSSVFPGEYMGGLIKGQINFPGWLGKYSKSSKRSRLAQELHNHTRVSTSGSRKSIRLDYAPFLLDAIVRPLKTKGADGVEDALQVIKDYRLLREDIESLVELNSWPGKKNPMDSVDGKVKAALTRAYNKEVLAYTYSATAGVKKKTAAEIDILENEEDLGEIEDSEDEDKDKLENDTLIKAKKKPAAKAKSTDTKKPSTSKAKALTSKSKK